MEPGSRIPKADRAASLRFATESDGGRGSGLL